MVKTALSHKTAFSQISTKHSFSLKLSNSSIA
jgi:hypothetical protein